MAANGASGATVSPSLTLVVYGDADAQVKERTVHEAERILSAMAVPHEILVIRPRPLDDNAVATPSFSPVVRSIASDAASDYREALKIGASSGRAPRLAFTNCQVDVSALRYFVPLAEQHPIVWGYRLGRIGPAWQRCISWCGNRLSRTFLASPVRDCSAGRALSVFRRSDLIDILPQGEEAWAPAEVIARSQARRLTVAEVPIASPRSPLRCPWAGFRPLLRNWTGCLRFWWQFQFRGRSPAATPQASLLAGILLAFLAALILCPGNQPLLEPDEARQAEIPREMLANGDLLLPRLLGLPYYEKPPLQYWLTAGAYSLFGVHPRVARLIPAFAAWISIMAVFLWSSRLLGARAAFLAGIGLCLSVGFVTVGRTVVLDSLLAACVVCAWYSAHTSLAGPSFRRSWWIASALACGLGFLAKGPVAFALLLPPVIVYQFLDRTTAKIRVRAWLGYVAIALIVPLPWYVGMAIRDPGYLEHFFWKANILRFVRPYDHEQPWWFYVPVLFAATFPWSLLWPALGYFLVSQKRRLVASRTPALGYCLLATLWCLLFFSLSGCKSPPYIVPALAPLSILVGTCLEVVIFRRAARYYPYLHHARQVLPWYTTNVMLCASAICYVVAAVLGWHDWAWSLALACACLALAFAWRWLGREVRPAFAWSACAIICLGFIVLPVRQLAAGYAVQHSPLTLTNLILHRPNSHKSPILSFNRQWLSASFYLNREVVDYYADDFTKKLSALLREQPEVLVFVENGDPLDDLLKGLPRNASSEVIIPDEDGTVALVIVRTAEKSRQQ